MQLLLEVFKHTQKFKCLASGFTCKTGRQNDNSWSAHVILRSTITELMLGLEGAAEKQVRDLVFEPACLSVQILRTAKRRERQTRRGVQPSLRGSLQSKLASGLSSSTRQLHILTHMYSSVLFTVLLSCAAAVNYLSLQSWQYELMKLLYLQQHPS